MLCALAFSPSASAAAPSAELGRLLASPANWWPNEARARFSDWSPTPEPVARAMPGYAPCPVARLGPAG